MSPLLLLRLDIGGPARSATVLPGASLFACGAAWAPRRRPSVPEMGARGCGAIRLRRLLRRRRAIKTSRQRKKIFNLRDYLHRHLGLAAGQRMASIIKMRINAALDYIHRYENTAIEYVPALGQVELGAVA